MAGPGDGAGRIATPSPARRGRRAAPRARGPPGLVPRRVPAALDIATGVGVAGPVVLVPHPPGVLQEELRVAAQGLLANRAAVQRADSHPTGVDLAQGCERQRKDDVVGHDVLGPVVRAEAARDLAIAVLPHGDEPLVEMHRPGRKPVDDSGDQLVVPAMYVPFLVRAAELWRRPGLQSAVRARVAAEQVNQVERRLLVGRSAVLVEDGGDAQLTEVAVGAAGQVGIEPVPDRHGVEPASPLAAVPVSRRPRRLVHRRVLEQVVPEPVPVAVDDALEPVPAMEAEGLLVRARARRVAVAVVQAEPEVLGECQGHGVLGIDELAVLLHQLVVVEVATQGSDPAARALRPLIHA